MAGERKGKTYEAITFVALHLLKNNHKLRGSIFWNETPEGMTIETDFVIGNDINLPKTIFLVTHGTSAKESNRKYWRNMGECVEAKTCLKTTPNVYGLTFDSIIKRAIKNIEQESLDGSLFIGDKVYGPEISAWVNANEASLPTKGEEKAAEITRIASSDKNLRRLIKTLASDLEKLIKTRNAPLDGLWKQERARSTTPAPIARQTFVRRGLSKLAIFEDLDSIMKLHKGQRISAKQIPDYATELNLVGKTIAGPRLVDEELISSIDLILTVFPNKPSARLRALLRQSASVGFRSQVTKVRKLGLLREFAKYVDHNYRELTTLRGMLRHLDQLHRDPSSGLSSSMKVAAPENVWLFDYIAAIVKAKAGKAQAFGYSAFSRHPKSNSSRIGNMDVGTWCSCFMNQYFNRAEGFIAPRHAIRHCALVLADAIRTILNPGDLAHISDRIRHAYIIKEYDSVLLAHRGFDPILGLMSQHLTDIDIVPTRACFAEAAGVGGQAGKTTVGQVSKTLINWQSCHGSHTNDKKKELCGRAVGLRYSWDRSTSSFIPRPGLEKLILVVDGTWRQQDLDALARAGWDHIFYPDEMDKLTAAIV